jgi:hypothetical protein
MSQITETLLITYLAPALIAGVVAVILALLLGLPLFSGWPLIPAAIFGMFYASVLLFFEWINDKYNLLSDE